MTTRKPRPGEVDGRDYSFVAQDQFRQKAAAGELLEWASVFGNSYGTPAAPVMAALDAGRDMLFDIDWQGCQQLHARLPADLVRVFILPPSAKVLEERLRTRAQDPPDVVARRMAEAGNEISHWAEYDYVIVNQDLDESLGRIKAILTAERSKRERQVGLADFVNGMRKQL